MYEWHGRLMIEAGLAKGYNCKKVVVIVETDTEKDGRQLAELCCRKYFVKLKLY